MWINTHAAATQFDIFVPFPLYQSYFLQLWQTTSNAFTFLSSKQLFFVFSTSRCSENTDRLPLQLMLTQGFSLAAQLSYTHLAVTYTTQQKQQKKSLLHPFSKTRVLAKTICS